MSTGTVIDLAAIRARRTKSSRDKYSDALSKQQVPPDWKDDIRHCCAYARMLRADHDAERARIEYEATLRGSCWSREDDLRERVEANNIAWVRYQVLLGHLAMLPAKTRGEASDKRRTIGKMWLSPRTSLGTNHKPGTIGEAFAKMREGCLADDHLFPPSMKLARFKGKARLS